MVDVGDDDHGDLRYLVSVSVGLDVVGSGRYACGVVVPCIHLCCRIVGVVEVVMADPMGMDVVGDVDGQLQGCLRWW